VLRGYFEKKQAEQAQSEAERQKSFEALRQEVQKHEKMAERIPKGT
jgi:hypothetical protein